MIVNEELDQEVGGSFQVHHKDLTETGKVKEEVKASVGWRFTGDSDNPPAMTKVHAANSQTLRAADCAEFREIATEVHVDMFHAANEGSLTSNQRDLDGEDYNTVGNKAEYTNIQNIAEMFKAYRAPDGKPFGEAVGMLVNTHAGGLNLEMGLINYLQDTLSVEKIDGKALLTSVGYELNAEKLRLAIEEFTKKCSAKGFDVKKTEAIFDQNRLIAQPDPRELKAFKALQSQRIEKERILNQNHEFLEKLVERREVLRNKQLATFKQMRKEQMEGKQEKEGKDKKGNPPPQPLNITPQEPDEPKKLKLSSRAKKKKLAAKELPDITHLADLEMTDDAMSALEKSIEEHDLKIEEMKGKIANTTVELEDLDSEISANGECKLRREPVHPGEYSHGYTYVRVKNEHFSYHAYLMNIDSSSDVASSYFPDYIRNLDRDMIAKRDTLTFVDYPFIAPEAKSARANTEFLKKYLPTYETTEAQFAMYDYRLTNTTVIVNYPANHAFDSNIGKGPYMYQGKSKTRELAKKGVNYKASCTQIVYKPCRHQLTLMMKTNINGDNIVDWTPTPSCTCRGCGSLVRFEDRVCTSCYKAGEPIHSAFVHPSFGADSSHNLKDQPRRNCEMATAPEHLVQKCMQIASGSTKQRYGPPLYTFDMDTIQKAAPYKGKKAAGQNKKAFTNEEGVRKAFLAHTRELGFGQTGSEEEIEKAGFVYKDILPNTLERIFVMQVHGFRNRKTGFAHKATITLHQRKKDPESQYVINKAKKILNAHKSSFTVNYKKTTKEKSEYNGPLNCTFKVEQESNDVIHISEMRDHVKVTMTALMNKHGLNTLHESIDMDDYEPFAIDRELCSLPPFAPAIGPSVVVTSALRDITEFEADAVKHGFKVHIEDCNEMTRDAIFRSYSIENQRSRQVLSEVFNNFRMKAYQRYVPEDYDYAQFLTTLATITHVEDDKGAPRAVTKADIPEIKNRIFKQCAHAKDDAIRAITMLIHMAGGENVLVSYAGKTELTALAVVNYAQDRLGLRLTRLFKADENADYYSMVNIRTNERGIIEELPTEPGFKPDFAVVYDEYASNSITSVINLARKTLRRKVIKTCFSHAGSFGQVSEHQSYAKTNDIVTHEAFPEKKLVESKVTALSDATGNFEPCIDNSPQLQVGRHIFKRNTLITNETLTMWSLPFRGYCDETKIRSITRCQVKEMTYINYIGKPVWQTDMDEVTGLGFIGSYFKTEVNQTLWMKVLIDMVEGWIPVGSRVYNLSTKKVVPDSIKFKFKNLHSKSTRQVIKDLSLVQAETKYEGFTIVVDDLAPGLSDRLKSVSYTLEPTIINTGQRSRAPACWEMWTYDPDQVERDIIYERLDAAREAGGLGAWWEAITAWWRTRYMRLFPSSKMHVAIRSVPFDAEYSGNNLSHKTFRKESYQTRLIHEVLKMSDDALKSDAFKGLYVLPDGNITHTRGSNTTHLYQRVSKSITALKVHEQELSAKYDPLQGKKDQENGKPGWFSAATSMSVGVLSWLGLVFGTQFGSKVMKTAANAASNIFSKMTGTASYLDSGWFTQGVFALGSIGGYFMPQSWKDTTSSWASWCASGITNYLTGGGYYSWMTKWAVGLSSILHCAVRSEYLQDCDVPNGVWSATTCVRDAAQTLAEETAGNGLRIVATAVENTGEEADTWALHGSMIALGFLPQAIEYLGWISPQYRWITEGISLGIRVTTHYFGNHVARAAANGRDMISSYIPPMAYLNTARQVSFAETVSEEDYENLINANE